MNLAGADIVARARIARGVRQPGIVTEGPEDALSLAQELPGREVWACLGTAFMIEAQYPSRIRSIVIAGQNDKPGREASAAAVRPARVSASFSAPTRPCAAASSIVNLNRRSADGPHSFRAPWPLDR
ncbi:toprim domain-containing protein [Sphingomonas sp. Mn802worker]|uniref:toprim domain-containing protein n=1 Tax=Sphingomonas sp. Mn802worker TaxID=629773 RepID=UPI003FD03B12